jgi:lipopolysaccharide/colanic/teichoic acid biosynthesis glycosyltransferase
MTLMRNLEEEVLQGGSVPDWRIPTDFEQEHFSMRGNAAIDRRGSAGKSPPPARPRFPKVLPAACFIEQVRLERLRVDRTGVPLSLAVLPLRAEASDSTKSLVRTFSLVGARIRETDIVGFVDGHTLGILLPNTDRAGIKEISGKLADLESDLFSAVHLATYPHQVFDRIAKAGRAEPDMTSLIAEHSREHSWLELALKRGLDIVGSLVGIVLFSPLMLLIVLAIKLTSPGPAVFKQTRLGRYGVPFTFYKFRSMHLNTDDSIHREYVTGLINGDHDKLNQGSAEKPLFKIKSDPRITRVGRIIRKTSMDELPQFFNVLKGDMSLVGPRPCIAYEAEHYEAWHLRRILELKPGITGLWQVEGRSQTNFDDMVRLDIEYVNRWSVGLDLKLLLKTLRVVFECGGAV